MAMSARNVNGITEHKIAQASLWTRPKLNEFIQHVKRDASSIIVVGRGETVTVRVPTHEHGKAFIFNSLIQILLLSNYAMVFFYDNRSYSE